MTGHEALVERLRRMHWDWSDGQLMCEEAADCIEALVARLRDTEAALATAEAVCHAVDRYSEHGNADQDWTSIRRAMHWWRRSSRPVDPPTVNLTAKKVAAVIPVTPKAIEEMREGIDPPSLSTTYRGVPLAPEVAARVYELEGRRPDPFNPEQL